MGRHTQKRRAGRLRGWVRPREDHSLNLTTDDSTSRRRRRRRDRGDWHVVPREQTERERERERRANVRGTRKNEEGREGAADDATEQRPATARPRWPGGRIRMMKGMRRRRERERTK